MLAFSRSKFNLWVLSSQQVSTRSTFPNYRRLTTAALWTVWTLLAFLFLFAGSTMLIEKGLSLPQINNSQITQDLLTIPLERGEYDTTSFWNNHSTPPTRNIANPAITRKTKPTPVKVAIQPKGEFNTPCLLCSCDCCWWFF